MEKDNLTFIENYYDEEKTKIHRKYYIDSIGRFNKTFERWYENGNKVMISNWKNNACFGKSLYWNEDGTTKGIETYHLKKIIHGTEINFQYAN